MSEILEAIDSLPDISFIDGITLQGLQNLLISAYLKKYEEVTGRRIRLAKADPNRIILLANAQVLYQGFEHIDRAGKMNFLKYSYGEFLRNLAAFKNVAELEPKPATVNVKWMLAEPRTVVTAIPEGTRVTADFETFFESTEYNEIPIGETEITITMTCTEAGEKGNGFAPGEIIEQVDPLAFIDSIVNIDTSAGGTDEESDQSIAERTYLAPSAYSTAGPDDAYIYHAKNYDPSIGDVVPTSPTPGVVDIRFMMADGTIPSAATIAGLKSYLAQRGKRPLTDNLQVGAPEVVSYNITATYYINKSDRANAEAIQDGAEQAVEDYKDWQSAKIGRDINPDELRGYMKEAGVKRIVITAPEFTVLTTQQIAQCSTVTLTYGGLEDD